MPSYNTILSGAVPGLSPVPKDVNITVSNELGSFTFGPFHIKGTGLLVEGDTNMYGSLYVHEDSATIDNGLTITSGDITVHKGDINIETGGFYLNGIPLEATITSGPRQSILKTGLALDLDATDLNSKKGILGGAPQNSWTDLTYKENDLVFSGQGIADASNLNTSPEYVLHQFRFNGTGDYGRVASSEDLEPQRLSYGCYFRPNMHEGSINANFIMGKLLSGSQVSYGLYYAQKEVLFSQLFFSDGTISQVHANEVKTGQYHYAVATWDGTNHNLYISGILASGDADQGSPHAGKTLRYDAQDFALGAHTGSQSSFTGDIQSAHVYGGVIPEYEIFTNYKALTEEVLHKNLHLSGDVFINGQNIYDLASGNTFNIDGGTNSITGMEIRSITITDSSAGGTYNISGYNIGQVHNITNINSPGTTTVNGEGNDTININVEDSTTNLTVHNEGVGSTVQFKNYYGSNVNSNISGYLFVVEPGSVNTLYNLNKAFIDDNSGHLTIANSGEVQISGNNIISIQGGNNVISGSISGQVIVSGGNNTIGLFNAIDVKFISGENTVINSGTCLITGGFINVYSGNNNITGYNINLTNSIGNFTDLNVPVNVETSTVTVNDSDLVNITGGPVSVYEGTGSIGIDDSNVTFITQSIGELHVSGHQIASGGHLTLNAESASAPFSGLNIFSGSIFNAESNNTISITGDVNISGGNNTIHQGNITGSGYDISNLVTISGGVNTIDLDAGYAADSNVVVWYGNNDIDSNGTMTVYITGSGIFNGTMSPTTANITAGPYVFFQDNAVLTSATVTSTTGIITIQSGAEINSLTMNGSNNVANITGNQIIYIDGSSTISNSTFLSTIFTGDNNTFNFNDEVGTAKIYDSTVAVNASSSTYNQFSGGPGSIWTLNNAGATNVNTNLYDSTGVVFNDSDNASVYDSDVTINDGTNQYFTGGNISIHTGNYADIYDSTVSVAAHGLYARVLGTTISGGTNYVYGTDTLVSGGVNLITGMHPSIRGGQNIVTALGSFNIYTGNVYIDNPKFSEITMASGVDTKIFNSGVVNIESGVENVFGGINIIEGSDIERLTGWHVQLFNSDVENQFTTMMFPMQSTGTTIISGDFTTGDGLTIETIRNYVTGDVIQIINGVNSIDFADYQQNTGSPILFTTSDYAESGAQQNYMSGVDLVSISGGSSNIFIYNANAHGNAPHQINIFSGNDITVDIADNSGTVTLSGTNFTINQGTNTVTGQTITVDGGTNYLMNEFSGEIHVSGGYNIIGASGIDLTISGGTNYITGRDFEIQYHNDVTVPSGANATFNTNTILNPNTVNITGGNSHTLIASGGTGFIGDVSIVSDTVIIYNPTLHPGELYLSGSSIEVHGGTENFKNSLISGNITVLSGTSTITAVTGGANIYDSIVTLDGGYNTLIVDSGGHISGINYGINTIHGNVPYILSGETHIVQTNASGATGSNIIYVTGQTNIYGSGTTHLTSCDVDIYGGINVLTGDNVVFQSGASARLELSTGTANVYNNDQVIITGHISTFNVHGNDLVNMTGHWISGQISVTGSGVLNITNESNIDSINTNTLSITNYSGANALNIVTVPSGSFSFSDIDTAVISGSNVFVTGNKIEIWGGTSYITGVVTGIVEAEEVTLHLISGSDVDIIGGINTVINSGIVNMGDRPSVIGGTFYHTGIVESIDRFANINAYNSNLHASSHNTINLYSGFASVTGVDGSQEIVNAYDGTVIIAMETGRDAVVTAYDSSQVFIRSGISGAFVVMRDDSQCNILSGNINNINQGSGWLNDINIKLSTNYIWSTGVTTQAGANVIYSDDVDIVHGYNYFYNFSGEAEISGYQNWWFDSTCHGISGYDNDFINGTNYVEVGTRHINDTFYTTVYETHYTQVARTGNFYTITHSTGNVITGTGDITIYDYSSRPYLDYSTTIGKTGTFIDVTGSGHTVTASGDVTINDYTVTSYYPDNDYFFYDKTGNTYYVTGNTVNLGGVTGDVESYVVTNNQNYSATVNMYGANATITGSGQTTVYDYSKNDHEVNYNIIEKSGVFVDRSGTFDYSTNHVNIVEKSGTFDYSTNHVNIVEKSGVFVDRSGTFDYSTNYIIDKTGTYITIEGDNDGTITGEGDVTVYAGTFVEKSGTFITVSGDENVVTGSDVAGTSTTIYDYSNHYDQTETFNIGKSGTFITVSGNENVVTGSGLTTIYDYSNHYDQSVNVDITVSGDENVVTGSGVTTIYDYSNRYDQTQTFNIDRSGTFIDVSGTGNTVVGISGLASGASGVVTINDYTTHNTVSYDNRVLVDKTGTFITVSGSNITVTGSGQTTIHDYSTTLVDKSKTITIDLVSGYPTGIVFNTIGKSGTFLEGSGQTLIISGSNHTIWDYSQTTVYPDSTIIQLTSGFPTGVFREDWNYFHIDISGGTTSFSGVSGLINISGNSINHIHDAKDIDIYNPQGVTISGGFNQFTGTNVWIYDSEDYFQVLEGGVANLSESTASIGNSGVIYVTSTAEGATVINNTGFVGVTGFVTILSGNTTHVSGSEVTIHDGYNIISGNEEVNIYSGEVVITDGDLINITNPSSQITIEECDFVDIDATGAGVNLVAYNSNIDITSGTTHISGANPVTITGGLNNLTGCTVTIYSGLHNEIHDSTAFITGHIIHVSGGTSTITGHDVTINDGTNVVSVSGGITNLLNGTNTVEVDTINSVTGGLNTFHIYESGNVHIHSGVDTNIYATGNDSTRIDFHFSGTHNTDPTTNIYNTVTDSGNSDIHITQYITGANSSYAQLGIQNLNITGGNVSFTGQAYAASHEYPAVTSISNSTITSTSQFVDEITTQDANSVWNIDGPVIEAGAILSGEIHHSANGNVNAVYGVNTLTNSVSSPISATTTFDGNYVADGGHLGITGSGINIYSGITIQNIITGDGPFATGEFNITQGVNTLNAAGSTFVSADRVDNAYITGATMTLHYYSGSSGQNFITGSTVSIYSGTSYITGGIVTVSESINDIKVTISDDATESLILTNSTNYVSDSVAYITGSATITDGTNYVTGDGSVANIYAYSGTINNVQPVNSTVNFSGDIDQMIVHNNSGGVVNITGATDVDFYSISGEYNIYGSDVDITNASEKIAISGDFNTLSIDTGIFENFTGTITTLNQYTGYIQTLNANHGSIGTINLTSDLDITSQIITGSGHTVINSSHSDIHNFNVDDSTISNLYFETGVINITSSGVNDYTTIGNIYASGSGQFDIDYFTGTLNYSFTNDQTVGSVSAYAANYQSSASASNTKGSYDNNSQALTIEQFTGTATIDMSQTYSQGATTSSAGYASNASVASPNNSHSNSPVDVSITNHGDINLHATYYNQQSQSSSAGGYLSTINNGPMLTGVNYSFGITGGNINITGSQVSGRFDNTTVGITGGTTHIVGRQEKNSYTNQTQVYVDDSDILITDSNVTLSGTQPTLYVSGGENNIHADGFHMDVNADVYADNGSNIILTGTFTGQSINIISGTTFNINSTGIIESIILSGGINNISGDELDIYASYVTNAAFNNASGSQATNLYLTGQTPIITNFISGNLNATGTNWEAIRISGGTNTFYVATGQSISITGGNNTVNGGTATIIGNIDSLVLKDSRNYVTGHNITIDGGTNYATGEYVYISGSNNYITNSVIDDLNAYGGVFHLSGNTGIQITGQFFTVNISGYDNSVVNITGKDCGFHITGTANFWDARDTINVAHSTVHFHDHATGVYITGGNNTLYLSGSEAFIDQSFSVSSITDSVVTNYNNLANTIYNGSLYVTGNSSSNNIYLNHSTGNIDFKSASGYIIASGGINTFNNASGVTVFDSDVRINDSDITITGNIGHVSITGGTNTVSGVNIGITGGGVLLGVHGGEETDVLIYDSDVTISGTSYISGHTISVTNREEGNTYIQNHDDQINVYYNPENNSGAKLDVTTNSGSHVNIYQFRNLEKHTGSFVDVNRIGSFGEIYQNDNEFTATVGTNYGYGSYSVGDISADVNYNNTGSTILEGNNQFITNITGGEVTVHSGPYANLNQGGNTSNGSSTVTYNNDFTWTGNLTSTTTIDNSTVTLTGNYSPNIHSGCQSINYLLNETTLTLTNPTGFINGTINSLLFTGDQLNVTGKVTITNGSNITTNNTHIGHYTDSTVSIIDTNIGNDINIYGGLTQVHGTNPITFNFVTGDLHANTVIDVDDPSHILVQGDIVQFNTGENGTTGFMKAIANSNTGTENVVGLVVEISGGGFKYVTHGETPWGSVTGFNYGKPIYLSDTTHGLMTTTKPTTAGSIVKRIGTAVNRKIVVNIGDDSNMVPFNPTNTGAQLIVPEFFGAPETSNTDHHYHQFIGAATIFTSKELDLTQTATHTIHIDQGQRFFCDEFGLIITDSSVSPVLHGPRFQMGISGDLTNISNQYIVPAIDNSILAHERIRLGSPNDTVGVNNIITSITSGATAGTLHGKFYWKGFTLQEEVE